MMRSKRTRARYGHKGCYCCYGLTETRRMLRTRENRAWRRDI